jgi:hypothetical protein
MIRGASQGKTNKSCNNQSSKLINYSALSYLSENSVIVKHPSSIDSEEDDLIVRNRFLKLE